MVGAPDQVRGAVDGRVVDVIGHQPMHPNPLTQLHAHRRIEDRAGLHGGEVVLRLHPDAVRREALEHAADEHSLEPEPTHQRLARVARDRR